MHIPTHWTKAHHLLHRADGTPWELIAWGWGEDPQQAQHCAEQRLQRALERLQRGALERERGYSYPDERPLREEILQRITAENGVEPSALVTRNRYGAEILNTSRMLFLDIDLPPAGIFDSLLALFGRPTTQQRTLEALRAALQRFAATATFRLYRTAAGYRVVALGRDFDPRAAETEALMQASATDPAFARLCRQQESFRARLTPKPWRFPMGLPPGRHPRDAVQQRPFSDWLADYQRQSRDYAVCHYLESIGEGTASREQRALLALHDEKTRCNEKELPLA